jgi:hypothetical protein
VRVAILLLAVLACAGLRLIHLEADTPSNVGTGSMGLYIDEGYKTLAARNTVQFGAPRWHPQDQYRGWQQVSGLTHWPFVASFRLFDTRLGSARLVPIVYFLCFLALYAFLGTSDRSTGQLLAGILLLSVSYVFFFFSRAALLEVPIATLAYGALFALRSKRLAQPAVACLLIAGLGGLATFGIKRSAVLYFLPILAGFVVSVALDGKRARLPRTWAAGALGVLLLVAYLTRDAWTWRLEVSVATLVSKIFVNQMTASSVPESGSSVLLVFLGLLCAFHLLALRPRQVLGDPYRCALLAMATLAPALLGLFAYTPLRYYVPVLPAYVLLFLEWRSLAPWSWQRNEDPKVAVTTALPVLVLLIFVAGLAFNELVLYNVPLAIGDTPGISVPVFYRIFLSIAILAAVGSWPLRHRFLSTRLVPIAVGALLLAATARDLWVVGRFLSTPSYQSREIARALEEIVGTSSSIAGDIAPFFALGTGMRALLIAPHANSPDLNRDLRYDFFEYSATNEGEATRRLLEESGVSLGPALYASEYAGRAISLHRVRYAD